MQDQHVRESQSVAGAGPGRENARLTFGYLTPTIEADQPQWSGVVDEARKRDVNLFCFTGGYWTDPGSFQTQASVLYDLVNAENVDGVISWASLIGAYVSADENRAFHERYSTLPLVAIGGTFEGIPNLVVDTYKGMHAAIVHLIEAHGHRRLAFISGPEGNFYAQERYQAYVDTLQAHGIPLDPNLVTPPVPWDTPMGMQSMRLLLDERRLRPRVDFEAIVAASDHLLLGALEVLREREIQVPGDVAAVGFNDILDGRVNIPPLTTGIRPSVQVGYQAVETLLALIEGAQVPAKTVVPSGLVIRQSCGCLGPAMEQAAVGLVEASTETLESVLASRRAEILSEMSQAVGESEKAAGNGAERLLEGFVGELKRGMPGLLMRELDEVSRQVMAAGSDVAAWQGAISALRRLLLPHLSGPTLAQAEDLWQQARVAIAEKARLAQAQVQLQAARQAQMLREIGAALITTFDTKGLMDVLAESLPRLGIPSCYLSLYENSEKPVEWSRLMMAYNENGRIELEPGGRRFRSQKLAPDGVRPQGRQFSYVVEPLYFQKKQLGFVLFEIGPQEGAVYETLREQISSSLYGATLVQQVERRAIQLQTAAEVSRAASSILDLNELLSRTVELIHDRFDLYYTGLFLVDQTGEWTNEPAKWAVLRAGTGEAGQKMLSAGHKLEVGGSSMVGWCIANRKARIALDVGKEAVRFSNPLLPHTRSELALPLVSRGQVIGAMTVQSDRPAAFTQEDIASLQSMADQLANAIENARLFAKHRQAEEVLAQERNLLRALIDNIPDRIYAKDTESQFVICNLALARRMGKTSPDELIGKSDFDLMPRELAEQFYADEQAVIRSGQSLLNCEEPLETVDGKVTRWNLATKVPLRDSQGNIIGIVGVGREITERKQAEAALRYRLELEELVSTISTNFINLTPAETDNAIHHVLQTLGTFAGADRSYVFQLSSDGVYINNTHEWCAEGIAPQIQNLQRLIANVPSWWMDKLRRFEIIQIPHIADLPPEADDLRVTLEAQDIRSLVAVPMAYRQSLIGYLGFDSVRIEKTWAEEDIVSLKTVSEILASTLERERAEIERERLLTTLERRSTQLQTAAEISRAASSILSLDELLPQVVKLIRDHFDLYYAGLFLVDETGQHAILQAAVGAGSAREAGQKMLEIHHQVEVGGTSMVGWCIANRQARIALDVGQDAVRLANRLLPETRSEMALPLISRGQAIGALTIQSSQEAAFTEEDTIILQTMAGQIANAIENARLLAERKQAETKTQETLQELERLYRATSQEGWQAFRQATDLPTGYLFDRQNIQPAEDVWVPQIRQAVTQNTLMPPTPLTVTKEEGQHEAGNVAVAPLSVRGQVIGVVGVYDDPQRPLSPDELALVQEITEQGALALESARLFEQTQAALGEARTRAEELAALNELSQRLTARFDVAGVLEEAYRGAARLLDTTNFTIALYDEDKDEITFPLDISDGQRIDEGIILPSSRGMTGYVIRNREPVLIKEDATKWRAERGIESLGSRLGAQSWLGVPMVVGDRVLGALTAQSYTTPHAFNERNRDMLVAIANQTAIALQNARLFEQARTRAEELAILNEISRTLSAMLDREAVIKSIYQNASRLMDTTNFYVALYDSQKDEVSFPFYAEGERVRALPGRRRTGKGLTEYVIRTREPLLVEENVSARLDELGIESIGQESQSWLGAPMSVGERVIGVIAVQSYTTPRLYNKHHRDLLYAIASQAAVALENTRLFDEARTRAEEMAVLNELAQALSTRLDLNQVLQETYRGLSRLMDTTNFYIALYDPERNEVSFPINASESVLDQQINVMPADQGMTGYIIRNRTSVLIKDNVTEWHKRMGMETVGEIALSWLGVPLIIGDQVLGVMAVQSYTTPGLYDEHDRDLLNAFANQTAIAIQNARMFEQTRAALAEVEATHRRYLREQWETFLTNVAERVLGYVDGPGGLTPAGPESLAMASTSASDGLAVPIRLRGEPIGVLEFCDQDAPHIWSEDEQDLVEALADQAALALENARLFEETQSRARREQLINEITARVRASTNIETILRTAAEELSKTLNLPRTRIRLGAGDTKGGSSGD
jgi:PAS domain S-box-containing protein